MNNAQRKTRYYSTNLDISYVGVTSKLKHYFHSKTGRLAAVFFSLFPSSAPCVCVKETERQDSRVCAQPEEVVVGSIGLYNTQLRRLCTSRPSRVYTALCTCIPQRHTSFVHVRLIGSLQKYYVPPSHAERAKKI